MPGVNVILDEATPLIERCETLAQARGLALVGARAVGTLVRDHLFGLDGQRHRSGGSHYFAQAARSITTGLVPEGAAVSITQIGFRQRLYGGTITAGKGLSRVSGKPTQYLTIPASPEAYDHRAGEFNDLEFKIVMNPATGSLQPALVRRVQTRINIRSSRGKDGVVSRSIKNLGEIGGEVMFWLVRSVTQKADPTVLPYDEQMSAAAVGAMLNRFERLQNRTTPDDGGDN